MEIVLWQLTLRSAEGRQAPVEELAFSGFVCVRDGTRPFPQTSYQVSKLKPTPVYTQVPRQLYNRASAVA